MPTPNKKRPAPAPDPAQIANQRVLEQRQQRIDEQMREVPDLGLDLHPEPATTAGEYLRDEWEKKAFGDEPETITRWVYGPHPLLDTCPSLKESLEKYGLEAYAEATALAILKFEHKAVPDPVMRRGLFGAIRQFGKERVAEAFKERILKIPARQVEYETGSEDFGDPELMGSNALRDCARKYGKPGMAIKFLSPRCIDVLGLRGYTIVLDGKGDPVRAGTLLMGEIPQHIADRRRAKSVRESEDLVKAQEDEYMARQESLVRQAGAAAAGSRPLNPRERVKGAASENESMLGESFEMGVHVGGDPTPAR